MRTTTLLEVMAEVSALARDLDTNGDGSAEHIEVASAHAEIARRGADRGRRVAVKAMAARAILALHAHDAEAAQAAAPTEAADPRWQPGAVWEHRSGSLPHVATFTLQRVDANGDVVFLDVNGRACWSTREDMTAGAGCGWRFVGKADA